MCWFHLLFGCELLCLGLMSRFECIHRNDPSLLNGYPVFDILSILLYMVNHDYPSIDLMIKHFYLSVLSSMIKAMALLILQAIREIRNQCLAMFHD